MGFKSLGVLQISNLLKGSCIFVELPLRSSVFCTSRRALLHTNRYVGNGPMTCSIIAEFPVQVCWSILCIESLCKITFLLVFAVRDRTLYPQTLHPG